MPKQHHEQKLRNLLLLLNRIKSFFTLGAKLLESVQDVSVPLQLSQANGPALAKLGLSTAEIAILINPNWNLIERDLLWAEQNEHQIITIYDNDYPELLREIPNPPLLLFVVGNLQLLSSLQVAIVGSRNPTPTGLETARDFAASLASAGLVITSGFALGIDAASHQGAMLASGKTIAVMGTGLNRTYPSSHRKLAEKIIAGGGVLLSEFPLDAAAQAWHFPLRNRIISGLSLGTLVVEATMRSGSLITARLAGEQGREVFAIPGSIYNSAARGCHYLLRQGAKLVEKPQDILEELPQFIAVTPAAVNETIITKKNKLDCSYKKLLDCVGFEVTTVDMVVARSSIPVSRVGAMLVELEFLGLIKRAPSKAHKFVLRGVYETAEHC